jgi:hypothetical protein
MNTDSSSTADSSRSVVDRLQEAVQRKKSLTFEERFEQIERLHNLAISLEERGILARETYKAATKEDFRRIYGDVKW